MTGERFGLPAILLHWLHAVLIVALLVIGWSMVDLPKGAERSAAIGLHKSLGLCAFAIVFLRALWRWRHPPPAASAQLQPWERRLAAATHHALYLLLFVVPLAGYLSASFTKYPMKLFGLALPRIVDPDEALNAFFNSAHKVAVWSLVALVALHVAGALHHALRRDGIMSRMLPGRSRQA